MVSTKPAKKKNSGKEKSSYWDKSPWDLGAVIVALLGMVLLLVSFLSKPQIVILHHTVVLTQGIVAPAIVLGAIAWALVEYFTPPGVGITDLLVRIIPSFAAGGFLGGLLGYYYHFGQYVIEPAFAGNPDAILFLIAALVACLATTKGSRVTPEYMGKIAEQITEKTGIRFSWHKCRHTYAKMLLRSGVDLETIRIMLGHENLGTTQIYATIGADEALERVFRSNVKFVKVSLGYKSIKPCTFLHGPKGI